MVLRYLKFYSSKEGMITDFYMMVKKNESFIVIWYFFVLEFGQKEYMVVLPWMITDFKWCV